MSTWCSSILLKWTIWKEWKSFVLVERRAGYQNFMFCQWAVDTPVILYLDFCRLWQFMSRYIGCCMIHAIRELVEPLYGRMVQTDFNVTSIWHPWILKLYRFLALYVSLFFLSPFYLSLLYLHCLSGGRWGEPSLFGPTDDSEANGPQDWPIHHKTTSLKEHLT